jgi:hypothetical protein
LTSGHKGGHFTPVHQQRRKRRVLFTQAQVSTLSLLQSLDEREIIIINCSWDKTSLNDPQMMSNLSFYLLFLIWYYANAGLRTRKTFQTTALLVCSWERTFGSTHSFDSNSGRKRLSSFL